MDNSPLPASQLVKLDRRTFLEVTGGLLAHTVTGGSTLPAAASLPNMQKTGIAILKALSGCGDIKQDLMAQEVYGQLAGYVNDSTLQSVIGNIGKLSNNIAQLFKDDSSAEGLIRGYFNAYPPEECATDKLLGEAQAIAADKTTVFTPAQKKAARDMLNSSESMPDRQWEACRDTIIGALLNKDLKDTSKYMHKAELRSGIMAKIFQKGTARRMEYLKKYGIDTQPTEHKITPADAGNEGSNCFEPISLFSSPAHQLSEALDELPVRDTNILADASALLKHLSENYGVLRGVMSPSDHSNDSPTGQEPTDTPSQQPKTEFKPDTMTPDEFVQEHIAEHPARVVAVSSGGDTYVDRLATELGVSIAR
jgi:hypothetical protein